MIIKIHKSHDGRKVIAVCDSGLLGKKFEDGGKQLDLSSSFYQGEEIKEEELLNELKQPCSVNIVGKRSLKFFIDKGLIDEDCIIKIDGVPHAQCVLVGD